MDVDDIEDFSDLFDMEAETVTVGKHTLIVEPLKAASMKLAENYVKKNLIEESEAESFLAFMAIKKNQPQIKWKDFNEKWLPAYKNPIIAAVFRMNRFLEIKAAIDGGQSEDSDEPIDVGILD